MKKQLFLIPVVGAFLLAGCQIKIGNKVFKFFEKNNSSSNEEGLPSNFKEEYNGYKLARSVKNGGRYILGVYRTREDKMRFANGDYHYGYNASTKVDNDWFPFYLGTVEGSTEEAAEIEVKFTSNDEFTMQVFAEGKPWDKKYIGVYAASSSFGNSVMSIALLDDPEQASYKDPKSNKTFSPSGTFKYFESYDGTLAYAPAAMFLYPGLDEEAVPKFLGTGHNPKEEEDDYTSMDSKSYEVALDYEQYDLAHLYEKK